MTGRSVCVPLDTNVDSFVRPDEWDQATDSGACANGRFLEANPAPSTAGPGRVATLVYRTGAFDPLRPVASGSYRQLKSLNLSR
jgi:hypothetical protein